MPARVRLSAFCAIVAKKKCTPLNDVHFAVFIICFYAKSRFRCSRSFSRAGFFSVSSLNCSVRLYMRRCTCCVFCSIFISMFPLPIALAMYVVMLLASLAKISETCMLSTFMTNELSLRSSGVIIFILSAMACSFAGSCSAYSNHFCARLSCVSATRFAGSAAGALSSLSATCCVVVVAPRVAAVCVRLNIPPKGVLPLSTPLFSASGRPFSTPGCAALCGAGAGGGVGAAVGSTTCGAGGVVGAVCCWGAVTVGAGAGDGADAATCCASALNMGFRRAGRCPDDSSPPAVICESCMIVSSTSRRLLRLER